MQKKGSLELSVNSIVILIIAIAILGLILGFVRGQFSKLEDQFNTDEPPARTATSSSPIELSRVNIVTSPGASVSLNVNMYNPTSDLWKDVAPHIVCDTDNDPGITEEFAREKEMAQNTGAEFKYIFVMPKDTADGTYLCAIQSSADTTIEKEIVITVN